MLRPLDAEDLVDDDATALVEREVEPGEERARANAGGPHERACRNVRAVRKNRLLAVVRLERRPDVDLDPASPQAARCVLAEAPRDLGEDLRRRVDEHPALRHVA